MEGLENKWLKAMLVMTLLLLILSFGRLVYFISPAYSRNVYYITIYALYIFFFIDCVFAVCWCVYSKRIMRTIAYVLISFMCLQGMNYDYYYTVPLFNVSLRESIEQEGCLEVFKKNNHPEYITYTLLSLEELELNQEYDWIDLEYHKNVFGECYYIKAVGGLSGE